MNGVDIVQTALRWAVLAASVAGVAGCGTAAKLRSFSSLYAEPTDGPVAQLRILANGMVRAVPGQSCVDWRSPGAGIMIVPRKGFTSHNGRDLGMPKPDTSVNRLDCSALCLRLSCGRQEISQ